jgi:hypothetical protein
VAGSFELKHNASLDVVIHCAASKHDFGISRVNTSATTNMAQRAIGLYGAAEDR